MERISALIEKLREQMATGADTEQLLLTTQLLEGELRYHIQKGTVPSSQHVAVVMPSTVQRRALHPEHERYLPKDAPPPRQESAPLRAAAPTPRPEPAPAAAPASSPRYEPAAQAAPQPYRPYEPQTAPARPAEPESSKYNPIKEVPTLTHQIPQEARRELNEVIAGESSRSLNDKWKEQQKEKEVSTRLTETPIRDLRKAVGINDRYLFISELFRGDETMYERSIKTINNFSIFQEAYYWMERELKLKLAWDQEKHSTQLFYQLVKRRFS